MIISDFHLRKSFCWVWGTITKFLWWNVSTTCPSGSDTYYRKLASHSRFDLRCNTIKPPISRPFLPNLSLNLSSLHPKQAYKCIEQARSVWAWSKSLIGDSFPDRVRRAINYPCHEKHHKTMVDKGLNLGLHSSAVKVRWITKGSLTIPELVCKLEAELPYLPQCKACIVQISSNNLCTASGTLFIHNLKTKLLPLLRNHGCTYIVLCQICHRKQGKYTAQLDLVDYNSKVDKSTKAWLPWLPPTHPWHSGNTSPSAVDPWMLRGTLTESISYQWVL